MEYNETGVSELWSAPSHAVIVHQSKTSIEPTIVEPVQCVKELRSLVPTRPDVAFYRTDTEFLNRFLKAKKYRVNEAFSVLCKYFQFRHQHRDLCVGLSATAPGVQSALLDGVVGVLPENDQCGRPILVILASNWDYSRYDVKTIYQAVLVTLDHLVESPVIQETGIVAIIDWSHFPAKHATSLSPKTLRMFLDGLQDSFPLRLGAIHVVSSPWYVDAAITLAKPFLKEKLKERVFIHGNNVHSLHSTIPARLLPAELGGEGGEYNALKWASKIITIKPEKSPKLSKSNQILNGMSSLSFDSSTLTQKTKIPNETNSLNGSLLQIY